MNSLTILDIFLEYNESVLKCIHIIEDYYGQEILSGAKSGKIPREGIIGAVEFKFHGAGCRVVGHEKWVDWDFPIINGKVGIDPWKLWQFTRDAPDKYGKFSNLETIRAELETLEARGKVRKSDLVGSNQYVVVE